MTFEEYKKQMKLRLFNFIQAYADLQALFENDEFDCNDFICEDYPFELSFDEYLIKLSDWQYSIEVKLENYKK